MRPPAFAFVTALGVLLAACSAGLGGPGGAAMPYSGADGVQTVGDAAAIVAHHPTGSQNAAVAIAVTDAVGSRVRDVSDQNEEFAQGAARGSLPANGTCVDGIQFFAPDRHGDVNSTETLNFYDANCRALARDAVRQYATTGSNSERVTQTVYFDTRNTTAGPTAVRRTTAQISNATIGRYGFPAAADGFARNEQSQLTIGSKKQILAGSEIVMRPSGSNVKAYCQDSAGYNAVGTPSLDATFGWQGGTLSTRSATRTNDGHGFFTWSSTQSGEVFEGPIGSLSIAAATANSACPIATPAYTLTGGTAKGAYAIPIVIRFFYSQLRSVAIREATVGNGLRLNVSTTERNAGTLIGGVISAGTTRVASFAANAFGNGALTITSTGAEYPIVDWNVRALAAPKEPRRRRGIVRARFDAPACLSGYRVAFVKP